MDIYSLVKQEHQRIDQKYSDGKYMFYAGKVAELLPRATPLSFSVLQQIYEPGSVFDQVMRNLNESVHFPERSLLETFMGKVYVNLNVEKLILYKNQPLKYKIKNNEFEIGYRLSPSKFFIEIPNVLIKSARDTLRIRFVSHYVERCECEYQKISTLNAQITSKMQPITVKDYITAYYSCIYIGFLHNFYFLWNRKALDQDPFKKPSAGVYSRVNNYLIRNDGELFEDNKYKSKEDFEFREPSLLEKVAFVGKKTVPSTLPELPDDLEELERAEVLLACLRDNARLKFLPFTYYLRLTFLKIAEDFKLGDDVFFYTLAELEKLQQEKTYLDETTMISRRQMYEHGSQLYLPTFLTHKNIHSVGMSSEKDAAKLQPQKQNMGIGCASGFVRGTVQYVKDPSDKVWGDILAFENASPAFTSLYKQAGGLIFRMGSPLSHGAIIARELGIPAVVLDVMVSKLNAVRAEFDGTTGEVLVESAV